MSAFNFFRLCVLVVCVMFAGVAAAQYEGQVVVTYDGPSEFAPSLQQQQAMGPAVYSGGSSGGQMMYQPVYTSGGYTGGSSGGAGGYTGGSSGGQMQYRSAPVQYYQAAPRYYQQPVRYYSAPAYGGGGGGFNFGAGIGPVGFNFGAGVGGGYRQPRMVCGPNGCSYQ